MRQTFLFLILTSCLCSAIIPGKSPADKFSITIKQWGHMKGGDVITRVTQDSIIVNGTNYDNEEFGYEEPLSASQTKAIAEAMNAIDLEKLESSYVNNDAPDDTGEFDFIFSSNDKSKQTHIYQTRVPEILKLVKTINTILPDDMKIGYTEEYLRIGK